eukprot:1647832-Rhodomonas_salina.1
MLSAYGATARAVLRGSMVLCLETRSTEVAFGGTKGAVLRGRVWYQVKHAYELREGMKEVCGTVVELAQR